MDKRWSNKVLCVAVSAVTMLCGCPDGGDDPGQDMVVVDMGTAAQDQGMMTLPDMGGAASDLGGEREDQGGPVVMDQGRGDAGEEMGSMSTLPGNLDEGQAMRREALVKLLCDIAFSCPSIDYDYLAVRGRYADRAVCEQGIAEDFELLVDDAYEQLAVTDKRAEFSLERATSCVQALRARLRAGDICQNPEGFFEEFMQAGCRDMTTGTVPNGGDCLGTEDCADPSAYCDEMSAPASEACYGTCFAFGGFETCDPECSDDQFCDGATLMCKPLQAFAQPCMFSSECRSDLFCGIDPRTNEPACQRRASTGSACDFDVECVNESFCDYGAQAPVCTLLKKEGEACEEYGQCEEGVFCDPPDNEEDERVCVREPVIPARGLNVVGLGAACGLGGNPIDLCESGLACIDLMRNEQGVLRGECGVAKGESGSCVQDSECAYPLRCEKEACTAWERAADGASCEYSDECTSRFCNPVRELCMSSSMCML